MRLRTLFNFWFPPINPVERKLLEAVGDRLTPSARAIFEKQIARINYVQRHSEGKEVNFYCMKGNTSTVDESSAFPFHQQEERLATVEFQASGIRKSFCATLWLVEGNLFCIEFDRSPRSIRSQSITVNAVTILIDPMAPQRTVKTIQSIEDNNFVGWMKDWARTWILENTKTPLSASDQDRAIKEIGVELPKEYLDVIRQTDGVKINNCTIFGLLEIRSVIMDESGFYVLAEFEGHGAICVTQDRMANSQLLFFDYESGNSSNMGESFKNAIESKLSENTGVGMA
jgi:hypothetical protein